MATKMTNVSPGLWSKTTLGSSVRRRANLIPLLACMNLMSPTRAFSPPSLSPSNPQKNDIITQRSSCTPRSASSPTGLYSSSNHHRQEDGSSTSGVTHPQQQSPRPPLKLIQGIRDIVDDYDVFLLDMWGVMHDGSKPYDGVLDVIHQLKHVHNKRLIILSNSSKRQDDSIRMLRKLGFDPTDFDTIITSGEVAFQMLRGSSKSEEGESGNDGNNNNNWLRYCEPWEPLRKILTESSNRSSRNAICLGSGDEDEAYLASCGWTLSNVESADLIVARGTFTVNDGSKIVHKRSNAQLYEQTLREQLHRAAATQRKIPMLVCNPDKIRPDVERPPMPGMLGDTYEQMLSHIVGVEQAEALVKRVGKPDRDVYDIALRQGQHKHRLSRACMVGDALETDVTGGSSVGIDTVWVLENGIHSPELEWFDSIEEGANAVLDAFNKQEGTYAKGRHLTPSVLLPSFRW